VRGGPLVVVGDVLLDRDIAGRADRLSPEAPVPVVTGLRESACPGGAGLAATLAAADGRDVVLVTALCDDEAGWRLRQLLAAAGVRVCAGRLPGRTPEKVRVRTGYQHLLRLDWEDGAAAEPATDPAMAAAVRSAGVLLAADYGRGLLGVPAVRDWLAQAAHRVPVVWDPHRAGAAPVPRVRLATPNLAEAVALSGEEPTRSNGSRVGVAARAGRALLRRWPVHGVAVTLDSVGALLATAQDVPLVAPARRVHALDTCGAGDRFATAVATALGDGALPSEAVTAAVAAATDYVEAGGAAAVRVAVPPGAGARPAGPDVPPAGRSVLPAGRSVLPAGPSVLAAGPSVLAAGPDGKAGPGAKAGAVGEVVRRTRARGGTVVATGGCFDLLHAGHVSTLEAARRLGDCLVVCVNSDESVRRLKGPHRPLAPVRDRARVLAALGCVDAVTVFEEDTPLAVLDRIRPDIWVKGGDYTVSALPETGLLARWGGDVVVVPYLEGRSTTGLVRAGLVRAGLVRAAAGGGRRSGRWVR
jgi:rfaE bifunctional protein nucleotidyltransferase chain/domain/rfaE bifunctional protein kinase chain/domain